MPFVTSSILGVDFNTASTTALFALNSRALGSDNSEWVYVKATGTLIAGIVASVQAAGTAVAPTTGQLLAPTGVAGGGVLAVVQRRICLGGNQRPKPDFGVLRHGGPRCGGVLSWR